MRNVCTRMLAVAFAAFLCAPALGQTKKPNILVIWGDDIGRDNISAYSMGIMGYQTPYIDRIAKEGAIFTDSYAQQSCTAGRASFILGEHPFRTGLLTIGMPGSPQGIPDWAPIWSPFRGEAWTVRQSLRTTSKIAAAVDAGIDGFPGKRICSPRPLQWGPLLAHGLQATAGHVLSRG